MKFHLSSRFSLLFIGLCKRYTPICYPCLSRTKQEWKLKAKGSLFFAFGSICANKVYNYKKTSSCLLNEGLHPLDFLPSYQGQQLLHLAAPDRYESIMLLYVHLTDILPRQSTFLI